MKSIGSMALLLALATLSCSLGPTLEEFHAQVKTSAGDGARDCGNLPLGVATTEQDACFADAARKQQAFFGFRRIQGIDSELRRATVRTPDGKYYLITHDSSICGDENRIPRCPSKIFTTACTPIIGGKNEVFACVTAK